MTARAGAWVVCLLTVVAPAGAQPHGKTGDGFDATAKKAAEAWQANRLADAAELYGRAVKLKPSWEEGHWHLGAANYELQRYELARDAFRSMLDLAPGHGPAWAMKGVCEYELGQYDTALADLLRALTLGFGGNTRLRDVAGYHTAILLTRIEEFEHALQLLAPFGREGNESPQVIAALGLALLRRPLLVRDLPASESEMVRLAGRAAWLAAARRTAEARQTFEELVARFPRVPNVHHGFGMFLLAEQPDQALEQFKRELALSATHVPARLQIALEHIRRGDYEAARPWATALVGDAPTHPEARRALGRLLLETGDMKGAIEQLEIGVRLAPQNAELRYVLARAYRRAGRHADADREQEEFKRLQTLSVR